MTNHWFAKPFIGFAFSLGVAGCQMADPDGLSLKLLETSSQVTEVVSTTQARTVGDLLLTIEESAGAAVQETVTTQAQKISAILATLEPTTAPPPPATEPTEVPATSAPEPLAESSEALNLVPAPLFAESLLAHNEVRAEDRTATSGLGF